MALKIPSESARLFYLTLFVVLLPMALIGWARGARANVRLPVIQSGLSGIVIAATGLLFWVAGILALRPKGGGLPMNALPPARLVTGGIYAVTAHPIYVGFTLMSVGIALACGSPAALWLVSPMLALAASALWWGYEGSDLRARLGPPSRGGWLGVPFASPDPPRLLERLGSLILTLTAPAFAAFMLYGAGLAGRPLYVLAESSYRSWAPLALIVAGVLAARTCTGLRDLILSSWIGTLLLTLLVLLLPLGPFGGRLNLAPDGGLLAILAMTGLTALLGIMSRLPDPARWALASIVGLFLLGRGALPSAESLLGGICFALANARWRFWRAVLHLCEIFANCWGESDFGAMRIIHIGWLAALPAFGGAAFAIILIGPGAATMTVGIFVFIIVGSALWAQFIEGSLSISRPYGFFGGVLAVVIFAVTVAPVAFNASPWLVLAAFATVAPWTQGLARLRCLANGCCHGSPCPASSGVIYLNPRTRVVRLANLGGVPIHPTQLYSLTGNILIGALIMRLWAEGATLSLITGLYFALMGLARFVEEAWRGEPQTPIYGALRLYQWVSIVCLVGGAVLTVIPGSPPAPKPVLSLEALWTGFAVGAIIWFVTSVDFPRSNRRFARLA